MRKNQAMAPGMFADALLASARQEARLQLAENFGRVHAKCGGEIVCINDEVLTINANRARHDPRQWPLAAAMVAKFVATTCETAIKEPASSA